MFVEVFSEIGEEFKLTITTKRFFSQTLDRIYTRLASPAQRRPILTTTVLGLVSLISFEVNLDDLGLVSGGTLLGLLAIDQLRPILVRLATLVDYGINLVSLPIRVRRGEVYVQLN